MFAVRNITEVGIMLNDEARRKVRELGWEELIDGVQAQAELPECLTLSFEARLSMLIDYI